LEGYFFMSQALIFGIGTSSQNINIVGAAAFTFNSENKSFALIGFKKAGTLKQLLDDFILNYKITEDIKPSIVFRSGKVATFFKRNNKDSIPESFKIRSLDNIDTFSWDLNNLYAVLIEAIGCGFLALEGLSKTQKEIIERSIQDSNDVLTQSLIVGTAQPPKIYDFSEVGTIENKAK